MRLGDPLTVTQNAQASKRQPANSLLFLRHAGGRLNSETNPETGTVTYTYDSVSPCADGNNYLYPPPPSKRTDNAGNSTCYAYDSLICLV